MRRGFLIVILLISLLSPLTIQSQTSPGSTTANQSANRAVPGVLLCKRSPTAAGIARATPTSVLAEEEILPGIVMVKTAAGLEEAVQRELEAGGSFEFVTRDVAMQLDLTPNDRLYRPQGSSIVESFLRQANYLDSLKVEGAWDITTGEPDITIAFIDTGYFREPNRPFHEEHYGQFILPGRRFAIDNGNESIEDENTSFPRDLPADTNATVATHGLSTSGIACALFNNQIGIAGLAPGCRLLPIRISNEKGEIFLSSVVKAIRFAADRSARVINMSLSPVPSPNEQAAWNLLDEAARYAVERGAVVVESAGNTGEERPVRGLKALEIISATNWVGGFITRQSSPLLGFSSFGLGFITNAAPGMFITTLSNEITIDEKGRSLGPYTGLSGTSLAAPIVTALYGLVFSINPLLEPDEAVSLVHVNSRLTSDAKFVGNGLVQFDPTVRAALTFRGRRPLVKGDLDFDRRVTITDLIALIQTVIGLRQPHRDGVRWEAADVNSDRRVSSDDVIGLIQRLQGR